MAIHLAALSWALTFILRLRFPPGKSIAKTVISQKSYIAKISKLEKVWHSSSIFYVA